MASLVDVYRRIVDEKVRRIYYDKNGYERHHLDDESDLIRLGAYKSLGFTEEAKYDKHWYIRYKAYNTLGWESTAIFDEDDDLCDIAAYKLGYKIIE